MKTKKRPKKKILPLQFPNWKEEHRCPRCGVSTGYETGYHSAGCKIADYIDGVKDRSDIKVVSSQPQPSEDQLQLIGLYRKINWKR